jgi:hypothetical protein
MQVFTQKESVIMSKEEPLQELLHRFETCLHKSDMRRSPEKLDRALHDRFVEFGSSGRVYDKDSMIAELLEETPVDITISDFKTLALGPEIVLVTYRANVVEAGDESAKSSLRSSIWKLNDGNWQMIFHQGTPVTLQ